MPEMPLGLGLKHAETNQQSVPIRLHCFDSKAWKKNNLESIVPNIERWEMGMVCFVYWSPDQNSEK